jgi:putative hydrolase of the HAD superfamily
MPPRWVIFDAVGTLITPEPSVAEAYAAIGRRFGVDLPLDTVRQAFRQAFAASETACFTPERLGCTSEAEEHRRWEWIVESVLPGVNDRDETFRELWDHFARPSAWRCYEDVAPTLAALQTAGIRVAIASNFDARLADVCRGFPELQTIERQFVSSQLGYRKPDPRFYAAVCAELGVAPSELLMLGDDHRCDVLGPQAAGWDARLIDRTHTTLLSAIVL